MKGFPITGTGIVMDGLSGAEELVRVASLGESNFSKGQGRVYSSKQDPLIPARLRRRMSRLSAMVFGATRQSLGTDFARDTSTPMIFATANGELNTIGTILDSLVDPEKVVSPTQFHNSVHNTPAGYWTIATKRKSPTSTISMGALSFEYAMLEAWCRLINGDDDLLVTAGDEAIKTPLWADPSHCTHDFCGSLRLSTAEVPKPVGRLVGVRQRGCHNSKEIETFVAALSEEFPPSTLLRNLSLTGGYKNPMIPHISNPCDGLLELIGVLYDPTRTGTIMSVKSGRDGDVIAIVVDQGASE